MRKISNYQKDLLEQLESVGIDSQSITQLVISFAVGSDEQVNLLEIYIRKFIEHEREYETHFQAAKEKVEQIEALYFGIINEHFRK